LKYIYNNISNNNNFIIKFLDGCRSRGFCGPSEMLYGLEATEGKILEEEKGTYSEGVSKARWWNVG
jgi:hypothetical protein